MVVDKIHDRLEIRECVDMYVAINRTDFIKVDKQTAYNSLLAYVKGGQFVRVVRDTDNKIIAWLYAKPGRNSHDPREILQQVYYASDQRGTKAVKCVQLLHKAMEEEAKYRNIPIVASQGSHADTTFVFTRILEKMGWQREGYLAKLEFSPISSRPSYRLR